MSHEAASIDAPPGQSTEYTAARRPGESQLLGLVRMMFGIVVIVAGAIFFASLLAGLAILVLWLRDGSEGVIEFYQEWRFDFRLRTLVGAAAIGSLYIGVAAATVTAAIVRGRRGWQMLLAFTPTVRGSRKMMIAIIAATLVYAVGATLAISLSRTTQVIISGATDYALVGVITANLVLLAPMAEELFFRGWLYTGLRNRLPFWPSFLTTAALFAAFHWYAEHQRVLLVLPLAIALGLLREVSGSIRPTIALHTVYNLIIIVIVTLLEI